MILKKYIIVLLVFLISFWKSFAYTTDDYFNIYYQWNAEFQDIYTVPEWKDLIITFLYADDVTNSELFFRDNWIDIAGGQFVDNKNVINLVVKDLLQLKDGASTNNYVITGVLVNEGQDINAIIDKREDGINKPIFTEYLLLEIYMIEGVIMLFLLLFKFIKRLLGQRKTRAGL